MDCFNVEEATNQGIWGDEVEKDIYDFEIYYGGEDIISLYRFLNVKKG